jgi:hypothetical protein
MQLHEEADDCSLFSTCLQNDFFDSLKLLEVLYSWKTFPNVFSELWVLLKLLLQLVLHLFVRLLELAKLQGSLYDFARLIFCHFNCLQPFDHRKGLFFFFVKFNRCLQSDNCQRDQDHTDYTIDHWDGPAEVSLRIHVPIPNSRHSDCVQPHGVYEVAEFEV